MIRWQKPIQRPKVVENIDLEPPEMAKEWFVFAQVDEDGDKILIHHGYSVAKAMVEKMAADTLTVNGHKVYRSARIYGGGLVYPPPESAKRCLCKGDREKQATCPTGHIDECHYPLPCGQAECRHMQLAQDDDKDPLLDLIALVATDRPFRDQCQPGDLGCLCSRCGKAIGRSDNPVVVQDVGGDVYRYHRECMK